MVSQVITGKGFEFAIAESLAEQLGCSIKESASLTKAEQSFNELNHTKIKLAQDMQKAAHKAVVFLKHNEPKLKNAEGIAIQADSKGGDGDVRDILVYSKLGEVGISAKWNNDAVKHSRLSDKIDFAKKWLDLKCTETYFKAIAPVFDDLKSKKGTLFSEYPHKEDKLYMPVLLAFKQEFETQQSRHGQKVAERLLHYMLGFQDFYKVIKEKGDVRIESFNLNGSLAWGKKLVMPSNILSLEFKENSKNTLYMNLNDGWALSFRIHNGDSKCIPSLKFDVRMLGYPKMAFHQAEY